jgi:hypothetical protein
LCCTTPDALAQLYPEESDEDQPSTRNVGAVMESRRMAVEEGFWPGCEEDPDFNRNGVFEPMVFWNKNTDTCIIQARREACENKLGFRLNENAFWGIRSFDVYQQVYNKLCD